MAQHWKFSSNKFCKWFCLQRMSENYRFLCRRSTTSCENEFSQYTLRPGVPLLWCQHFTTVSWNGLLWAPFHFSDSRTTWNFRLMKRNTKKAHYKRQQVRMQARHRDRNSNTVVLELWWHPQIKILLTPLNRSPLEWDRQLWCRRKLV